MGNTKNNNPLEWGEKLTPEAVKFTEPEVMVKLIATIGPNGYPHMSMITCNEAISEDTIKWGAFTEGRVKKYVKENPKQGLFYMSASMPFKFLQVKVDFTHLTHEGDDAEKFNKSDLLRYNTYLSVHTSYFNTVHSARQIRPLAIGGIVKGIIFPKGKKQFMTGSDDERLPNFGKKLLNGLIIPKLLAYIDPADGYPVILPCFQARVVEGKTVIIPHTQFKQDIMAVPERAKVAMFALDFETRNIQVKGVFHHHEKAGVFEIDEVHNGMPPVAGQIYPVLDVREKVTHFSL